MFVLELSKPSGVCLAAVERPPGKSRDALVGYLICSRYDRVWHLMNIAIDPAQRRQGLATQLLKEMPERPGREEPYTPEVRTANSAATTLYEQVRCRYAMAAHCSSTLTVD